MPFWILVLVGLIVMRRFIWGRGWAHGVGPPRYRHRLGARGGWHPALPCGQRALGGGHAATPDAPRSARHALAEPGRETAPDRPEARLQRDWVAGRISDEEFERGLDAVYADPRRR